MFTSFIFAAIALLAAAWLVHHTFARRRTAVSTADLHAQLDSMISFFDADDRRFARENRKHRRRMRQLAKQATESKTAAPPRTRKAKPNVLRTSSVQAPPDEQPAVKVNGLSSPSSYVTEIPVSSTLNTTSSAPLPELDPPPPKNRYWLSSLFSFCSRAAITAIFLPFQLAAKSLFTLVARPQPTHPPPKPVERRSAA